MAPNLITRIDELEDIFVKHWGDRKDYVYYLTEFGTLKKKADEYLADFIKRFNKIYNKMPADIKPSTTSAKLRFVKDFDDDFSLMLRERKSEL